MFDFFKKQDPAAAALVRICLDGSSSLSDHVVQPLKRMVTKLELEKEDAVQLARRAVLAWLAVCELSARKACVMERRDKTAVAFSKLFVLELTAMIDRIGGDRNDLFVFFDETSRGLPDTEVVAGMSDERARNQIAMRGVYLCSRISGHPSAGFDTEIPVLVGAIETIVLDECRKVLAGRRG